MRKSLILILIALFAFFNCGGGGQIKSNQIVEGLIVGDIKVYTKKLVQTDDDLLLASFVSRWNQDFEDAYYILRSYKDKLLISVRK